jgi:hypothetical protein
MACKSFELHGTQLFVDNSETTEVHKLTRQAVIKGSSISVGFCSCRCTHGVRLGSAHQEMAYNMIKETQIHKQGRINLFDAHNQEQGDLGWERFKTNGGIQLTNFSSGLLPTGAHLQMRLQSLGHREEAYSINFVSPPVRDARDGTSKVGGEWRRVGKLGFRTTLEDDEAQKMAAPTAAGAVIGTRRWILTNLCSSRPAMLREWACW